MKQTNDKRSRLVFEKNYMYCNENIYDMFKRVVYKLTDNKVEQELFLKGLNEGLFVPGGRIMRNIGRIGENGLPFNCTAIPSPKDDLCDIFNKRKMMSKIFQKQGGCGIDLSSLRYQGAILKTSGGFSSGMVSYMNAFSNDGGLINVGSNKRGALLIISRIDHPDIELFIDSKKDLTKITNANISVLITDEFIKAVLEDSEWSLQFNGIVTKTLKARYLYDKIIQSNYESGDCGIFFIDRVKQTNNTEHFQPINCFNACGEIPLPAYETEKGIVQGICNLTSLNLYNIYKSSESYNHFLNKVKKWSGVANEFLDLVTDETLIMLKNVLSKESDLDIKRMFEGIITTQKEARRNGLGFMGLASLFIAMGIRYGSLESLNVIRDIMINMLLGSYNNNTKLAMTKGQYPAYKYEEFKKTRTYKLLMEHCEMPSIMDYNLKTYGLRNSQILNCPPTGNTSIFAGNVSSGVEPIFEIGGSTRNDSLGKDLVFDKSIVDLIDKFDLQPGDRLPEYCVSIADITLEEQLNVLNIVCGFIENNVSKTINASNDISYDTVKSMFYSILTDYKDIKSITFYRNGTRNNIITSDRTNDKNDKNDKIISLLKDNINDKKLLDKLIDVINDNKLKGCDLKSIIECETCGG